MTERVSLAAGSETEEFPAPSFSVKLECGRENFFKLKQWVCRKDIDENLFILKIISHYDFSLSFEFPVN